MKRKIICVLLCVFMILPMFGAFVTGAAAAEVWTNVTVTSWEDLCTQLEKSEAANIKLGCDISKQYDMDRTVESERTLCVIHGHKTLDLCGYDIYVDDWRNCRPEKSGFASRRNTETLFSITAYADLTVKDSVGGATVRFEGYYVGYYYLTGSDYNDYYWARTTRNIFVVYGKLSVYGGEILAGGTKKQTFAGINHPVNDNYLQIFGTAVTVMDGGEFYSYGGTYEGIGRLPKEFPVGKSVEVQAGGKARIYDGLFKGSSGADVFNIDSDADFKLYAADMRTDKHDHVRKPDSSEGYPRYTRDGEYGCIGVSKSLIAEGVVIHQNKQNEGVYDPEADGNTTVTPPADVVMGNLRTAAGSTQSATFLSGSSCLITWDGYPTFYVDSKGIPLPEAVTDYCWTISEKTAQGSVNPLKTVHTSTNQLELNNLISWKSGTIYQIDCKFENYIPGTEHEYKVCAWPMNSLSVTTSGTPITAVSVNFPDPVVGASTSTAGLSLTTSPANAATIAYAYWYNGTTGSKTDTTFQSGCVYYLHVYVAPKNGYGFAWDGSSNKNYTGTALVDGEDPYLAIALPDLPVDLWLTSVGYTLRSSAKSITSVSVLNVPAPAAGAPTDTDSILVSFSPSGAAAVQSILWYNVTDKTANDKTFKAGCQYYLVAVFSPKTGYCFPFEDSANENYTGSVTFDGKKAAVAWSNLTGAPELYIRSATVKVEAPSILWGDANGDGKVDSKDLSLLRKYMAAYDYTSGTSTVAVEAGADANGDGKIDSKDLSLLRKYMAAYDYTTGTSTVVLGPSK